MKERENLDSRRKAGRRMAAESDRVNSGVNFPASAS